MWNLFGKSKQEQEEAKADFWQAVDEKREYILGGGSQEDEEAARLAEKRIPAWKAYQETLPAWKRCHCEDCKSL